MIHFLILAAALDLSAVRSIDATTPEEIQIALARAAAPNVSPDADIYVLGPHGYRLAVKGTNGFACLVDRDRRDTLAPICFDPEGAATTLHTRLYFEEERARGVPDATIQAEVETGYKSGRFIAPRRPGIVYMMSDYNRVFDPDAKKLVHFPGHLMFYAPYLTTKDIGSGPGAPYLNFPGTPQNLMIVIPQRATSH